MTVDLLQNLKKGEPWDRGILTATKLVMLQQAASGVTDTGVSPNLFNIVVTTSDQSTSQTWGGRGTTTNATSTTNGATNTTTIVATLGITTTYAARTCKELSVAGSFTSGWFLPSGNATAKPGNQLNCLYNNRINIAEGSVAAGGAGFDSSGIYWSSTEVSDTNAFSQSFATGAQNSANKSFSRRVRCSQTF